MTIKQRAEPRAQAIADLKTAIQRLESILAEGPPDADTSQIQLEIVSPTYSVCKRMLD